MELLAKLQKLAQDGNYFEAQIIAEQLLKTGDKAIRVDLLNAYLSILENQQKTIPVALVIEYVELVRIHETDIAEKWLNKINSKEENYKKRILVQKILVAETRGQVQKLNDLITEFQLYCFQRKIIVVPLVIEEVIEKYFQNDFSIQLRRITSFLNLYDQENAEKSIKDLLIACYEKGSVRGIKEKLNLLETIIGHYGKGSILDIYKNLCACLSGKMTKQRGVKTLIESLIYFKEFKIELIVLRELNSLDPEITLKYARTLRGYQEYDFVYVDKYFKDLKCLFISKKAFAEDLKPKETYIVAPSNINPHGQEKEKELLTSISETEVDKTASEDERVLSNLLSVQNFNSQQLLDLAAGFIQSDFPWACLEALKIAEEQLNTEEFILKVRYLRITAQMKLVNFRAAIDTALDALSRPMSDLDKLSFMYAMAESYSNIKEYEKAKRVFKKILQIDNKYRLAKEKLERLNEV